MDTTRFNRPLNDMAQAKGRRAALHSLGAAGMALLAALGLGDASARGSHKGGSDARVQADGKRTKPRKTKRGPAGPAGPTGPAGSADFTTRVENSAESGPLGSAVTNLTRAFADCGGEGKAVSCGYRLNGPIAEWASVFFESVGPDQERSGCDASLRRTTDVGATGGVTIQTIAICLV